MLKSLPSFVALLLFSLAGAEGQTPGPCRNQEVHYGPAPQAIEKKIQLKWAAHDIFDISDTAKRTASPQGTRWFVEIDPDYAHPGPWTTTLYIGNSRDEKADLKVVVTDHGNTFSAHWINEKLLFVQVWWGRIASSDLLLDVDVGKFIYDEFANYGELIEPCQ
jgi:hypothetical protein